MTILPIPAMTNNITSCEIGEPLLFSFYKYITLSWCQPKWTSSVVAHLPQAIPVAHLIFRFADLARG